LGGLAEVVEVKVGDLQVFELETHDQEVICTEADVTEVEQPLLELLRNLSSDLTTQAKNLSLMLSTKAEEAQGQLGNLSSTLTIKIEKAQELLDSLSSNLSIKVGEAQQQFSTVAFQMHTPSEEEQKMMKTYILEHLLAITPTPEMTKDFAVSEEQARANFAIGQLATCGNMLSELKTILSEAQRESLYLLQDSIYSESTVQSKSSSQRESTSQRECLETTTNKWKSRRSRRSQKNLQLLISKKHWSTSKAY
jgi:hypothetical protein